MTINSNSNVLEVLIFKTNISSKEQLNTLTNILRVENRISRWNIDRADRDNVLRIEGGKIDSASVIKIVCGAGFQCEELTG
jgi:hypothetical protein